MALLLAIEESHILVVRAKALHLAYKSTKTGNTGRTDIVQLLWRNEEIFYGRKLMGISNLYSCVRYEWMAFQARC